MRSPQRIVGVILLLAASAADALADPPERVARIGVLNGTVSFRAVDSDQWSTASMNYPLTIGDEVWTDRAGRLELEMGATAVDLDAQTAASVLNLDHHIVQLRLLQGTAVARVRELASDESVEVDTPNSAVTLLRPGIYRIWVSPSGESTTVTVRRGDVEVASGPSAFPVHADQAAEVDGIDSPAQSLIGVAPPDDFDSWSLAREQRVEALMSTRYVPPAVVGYEDLDAFGTWQVAPEFGPVWAPRVQAGWAPYRYGHWVWRAPWGWTWIDDAPWGFAPFHYGRWAFVGNSWVWVPGTVVARPVYAPALVAFVGGPGWQVGVANAPVGWFPLGPREAFVPAYVVSPAYVTALNRPHVTTVVNVNVTNVTYINRSVPGAVTVVSHETFVRARPVAPALVPIAAQTLSSVVVVGHAAPREIVPVAVPVRSAAAPPPATIARTVVVRRPPSTVVRAETRRLTAVSPAAPAAIAQPAPTPVRANPAPAPARANPTAPAPQPSSAVVPRPTSPNVAAELAARHAKERADIEARHATERTELQNRHAAEARTTDARAQEKMHARQAREQVSLDERQKREQQQLQARQEAERKRHSG